MTTAIVWFRRDLRLTDNPALAQACARHERVLPLYIFSPDEEAPWQPGAASRWWLHHSLDSLSRSLTRLGTPLLIRRGNSLETLRELARAAGATAVYWNRLYEPAAVARDSRIKAALRGGGLEAESFNASLWLEPQQIKTGSSQPYRVFTPFWKSLEQRLPPRAVMAAPAALRPGNQIPAGVALASLGLLPQRNWDTQFYPHWNPGEDAAIERLDRFCDESIDSYQQDRNLPSRDGTSLMSPHLHFGEISPVQVHARVRRLLAEHAGPGVMKNAEGFLREIAWREFAHHLLFNFPLTPTEPLNLKFTSLPWRKNYQDDLARWQCGQTGFPIIDAGMRQLWATGYMHNRVRMIAASLLTKNLLIPWQEGARWFWDTLLDADLANNTLGWQWVAGCGADAAPYFRVFNPVLQSEKFGAAAYIRRWVPELAHLPDAAIHAPPVQARGGYPAAMVDLKASRERALGAYAKLKPS